MKKNPAIAVSILLVCASTALAQPGSLDSEFNGSGMVTTSFGTAALGRAVAVQPDGKIVVAGYVDKGSDYDFALARYNEDGSLDNTFGTGGKVVAGITIVDDFAYGIALQPDGKILLAGKSKSILNFDFDFSLARFNSNGTPDSSFSADGKLFTSFGPDDDAAFAVVLQSDGKIVAVGESGSGLDADFAVARYHPNGTLDSSFSIDGKLTTFFTTGTDGANSVVVQPDGKIIAAGYATIGAGYDFALARYNEDGTLDNTFSGDGKVITSMGTNSDIAHSVALQGNGKIVVAGDAIVGAFEEFAVARYNSDGTLDNTFGVGGKVITDIGPDVDRGECMALQPDGKILVGGSSFDGQMQFSLLRQTSDGSPDTSFGINGVVMTNFGTDQAFGRSIALQPNGRIVLAGYTAGSAWSFAVARYISGLNLGVVDFALSEAPLISPNPIKQHATLQYVLKNEETISIRLVDMEGRTQHTFLEAQRQVAGEHQQLLEFPVGMPPGSYLIVLSTPTGKVSVTILRQD